MSQTKWVYDKYKVTVDGGAAQTWEELAQSAIAAAQERTRIKTLEAHWSAYPDYKTNPFLDRGKHPPAQPITFEVQRQRVVEVTAKQPADWMMTPHRLKILKFIVTHPRQFPTTKEFNLFLGIDDSTKKSVERGTYHHSAHTGLNSSLGYRGPGWVNGVPVKRRKGVLYRVADRNTLGWDPMDDKEITRIPSTHKGIHTYWEITKSGWEALARYLKLDPTTPPEVISDYLKEHGD